MTKPTPNTENEVSNVPYTPEIRAMLGHVSTQGAEPLLANDTILEIAKTLRESKKSELTGLQLVSLVLECSRKNYVGLTHQLLFLLVDFLGNEDAVRKALVSGGLANKDAKALLNESKGTSGQRALQGGMNRPAAGGVGLRKKT